MIQIQKLRLKRGWSQQHLAEACGLSPRTIQRIEAGQPASMETLKSLAAVFEIDYSTLNPEYSMDKMTLATEQEEKSAFLEVSRLKAFYLHLLQFIVINLCLNAFDLILVPQSIWAPFVTLFWGMGLVVHALTVFKLNKVLGPQWERQQIEKRLGRPL